MNQLRIVLRDFGRISKQSFGGIFERFSKQTLKNYELLKRLFQEFSNESEEDFPGESPEKFLRKLEIQEFVINPCMTQFKNPRRNFGRNPWKISGGFSKSKISLKHFLTHLQSNFNTNAWINIEKKSGIISNRKKFLKES